ncbi:MAG: hypothetical protein ACTHM6_11655 [Tepidisphaeraceae bacterium]
MKINKKLETLVDRYYARLPEFNQQYALHEGAVSEAFRPYSPTQPASITGR